MTNEREHEASEDCWCGPECVPVEGPDGRIDWMYRHHLEKHGR